MTIPPTKDGQNNGQVIRCGKNMGSKMVSSFHNDWKIDNKCYKYCTLTYCGLEPSKL
jgi:hypothetical protein